MKTLIIILSSFFIMFSAQAAKPSCQSTKSAFKAADSNSDKALTKEEYGAYIAKKYDAKKCRKLKRAYKDFKKKDADQNGTLTYKELKKSKKKSRK
jgi:Ca2+-binding EF-hand superfamily protein